MGRKQAGNKSPSRRPRGNPNWKKGGPSPNPTGRRRTDSERRDGWQSALTGIGMPSYDKRLGGAFYADVVGTEEARELWRGDDIAARIVETIPNEMLRQGFDLAITGDDEAKELQEIISSRWEDLGLESCLWHATAFERGFGGGAILLGVNDGASDLSKPLSLDRVRSLDWMTALEASELSPEAWYADPQAPRFGEVAIWRLRAQSPSARSINGTGPREVLVHESRLVIFPGIQVSRRQQSSEQGWGDSVLTRCSKVLRDFNMTWAAAGILTHDFAQAVFKIKGLAELIAGDKDSIVASRMQAVELSRSVARAILIDSEEDYERKATPLSGLPELLDKFSTRLAAAADMPLTLLMGQSPAGLNATGESDVRFFYDRVAAMQAKKLRPAIERVVKIIFRTLAVDEPESWSVRFRPLWQPTDKEQADARYVQAQTDAIYITNGVLSPEEVALSRFGGDEYSFVTQVDFAAREALEPAAPPPAELESGEEDADFQGPPPNPGEELPDVDETEAELLDRADGPVERDVMRKG